MLLMVSMGDAE